MSASRAFEIADVLEQGRARETNAEFLRPFCRGSKLYKFYVTRSDNKKEYTMFTDESDSFVMHAKFVGQTCVHFIPYHPDDKLYNPSVPSFVMTANSDTNEWCLYNVNCESCHYRGVNKTCATKGKQQIAHISHTTEKIGGGIFNCMDVTIPGLYTDGSRVLWCPKDGYPPLGKPLEDKSHHPHGVQLRTKVPTWNKEIESLVLDFKGRLIHPSAKNFQVALVKKPEYVIVQYGKVTANIFILDFRYPLSIIQAFAMALATYYWR